MWFCLSISICTVFPSVDVHFLPLSPLPSFSLFQVYVCVLLTFACTYVSPAWYSLSSIKFQYKIPIAAGKEFLSFRKC